MPLNKKKKKAAANPARGFATTSLPSKAKESHILEFESDTQTSQSDSIAAAQAKQAQSQEAPSDTEKIQLMSPEELEAHLEDAELQNIIENDGARCRQEATRQVSRLETERRQQRQQSHTLSTLNWLSDAFIEDVLSRHQAESEGKLTVSSRHMTIDENALLLRLWILKRVLVNLRLVAVDQVLEHVLKLSMRSHLQETDYIWGLDEAFEWYAVHCSPQDLPSYDSGIISSRERVTRSVEIGSNSDVTVPQHHAEVQSAPSVVDDEDVEEPEIDFTPIPTSESDDDDPSVSLDRYVELQTLLHNTLRKASRMTKTVEARKARLISKTENLKRDPLFDSRVAEEMWHRKLKALEIDVLQDRKQRAKQERINRKETQATDEGIDEDGAMLGHMFGVEEDEAGSQDATVDTQITLVDFGKWSGTQPRKLMEECCRSVDTDSKVRFSTLSSTSYSTRQKLEIVWTLDCPLEDSTISAVPQDVAPRFNVRRWNLEMHSIAAATPAQAESYLSTLVLFLLSSSGLSEQKQSARLPTVWRTVYKELEHVCTTFIDAEDRSSLKGLRSLIERLQTSAQATREPGEANKRTKQEQALVVDSRSHPCGQTLSPEQARDQWSARATSAAFQNILRVREQLPVRQYKDQILETVQQHQLTIICAETGAGKSTQVPSFILEHNLSNGRDCCVLVTQPRRISAISLARRVSQELGEQKHDLGTNRSLVGYAIRLESKVSRTTRVTFATTGVLLRMIESTPGLDDLHYLILDEVHERTMDLDLLFIALKKLQDRRSSLKIVLMSATVDAKKFSNYFGGAPILNVPGRTFPVEVKYLEDAVEATLGMERSDDKNSSLLESDDDPEELSSEAKKSTLQAGLEYYDARTKSALSKMDEYRIDYDLVANLAAVIATKPKYARYSSAILIFMPGLAEIRRLQNIILSKKAFAQDWVVHLLHSTFSTEDLEQAFSIPPSGYRKIVISTNIAETGITIPDVTAVIDTCKEKTMRFNERRQLSKLTEGFISRSSARQRKGRAARVQDGLCFHLVTKHRYENIMLEQNVVEMLRLSLQDPILRIKIWNLGSVEETLSAAIDPPTSKNIRRAIEKLKDAGALSGAENLTPLGRQLARLPLEVILGKLAIVGVLFRCLDAVLTLIASISSKSPFLTDRDGSGTDPRLPFHRGDSDLLSSLNAYQGWKNAKLAGSAHSFCRKNRLSDQNLSSIEDQKIQLLVYLVDAGIVRLEHEEKVALNKSRNAGHRKTFFEVPTRFNVHQEDAVLCAVIAIAFYPRVLVRAGKGWRNIYTNQNVSLASNSINRAAEKPPKWLSFYEAMQSKSGALNVMETTKIPEVTILTVLGEAEYKYFSGVVVLDSGKARFCLKQWRQMAAAKILRERIADVMRRCWQASALSLTASDQAWIDAFAAAVVAGSNTKIQ